MIFLSLQYKKKIKSNMKTNWSETQLAYFELCKLLKSVGYKQGSDKFFCYT